MAGKRVDTREMKRLRAAFFEEGKQLDANPDTRDDAGCWICRTRIDYTVAQASTPDSHTLDHYYPVEDYPELQYDRDNFRHAHFDCNSSRGKRAPSTGLDTVMPAWWK